MKKRFCLTFVLLLLNLHPLQAQDESRVAVGVKIPASTAMPELAKSVLEQKLTQLIAINGFACDTSVARFVVRPEVYIEASELSPGAPPKQLLKLSITLFLLDNMDEQLTFNQVTISAKGVGRSTDEAYVYAMQSINVRSVALKRFMDRGKKKMVEYYENECNQTIEKAYSLAQAGRCNEAFGMLAGVPQYSDCFARSVEAAAEITSGPCKISGVVKLK